MPTPAHAKEIAYPASIFGRLNAESGFGLLQRSTDKLDTPLAHEIERLAVRGWGAKPDRTHFASESIGHFRSREDPAKMHVFCVRPLPDYQPVRAMVTLPVDNYLAYACNPFAFARAGFFDFLDAFLEDPKASGYCAPASGPLGVDDPAPFGSARWRDATLAALIGPLVAGRSTILPVPDAAAAANVVEEIAWAMPIELRSRVALLSFAYSDPDALKGFAPVLACLSDLNGRAPGPDDDYGPADTAGLSAVLAARRVHVAALSGTSEHRTAHLYELLHEMERRIDEQAAAMSETSEHRTAHLYEQLHELERRVDEQAAALSGTSETPAEKPEAVVALTGTHADEDRDHSKPWRRPWLIFAGGLAVIGVAAYAGYSSRDTLERRIGTSAKPGTISERVDALEDSTAIISQRLVTVEAAQPGLREQLATLNVADKNLANELTALAARSATLLTDLGTMKKSGGSILKRLAALDQQWQNLASSLDAGARPATVPERLRLLRERLAELVAAVGLSDDAAPETLLGTVERLAAVAETTGTKAAQVAAAFAAAEQALVEPLRTLPETGTTFGRDVVVTWTTAENSGLVTIQASRRLLTGGTAPGQLLKVVVDGDAPTALTVEQSNNGLRLTATDSPGSVVLSTLRIRVGSSQAEILSITVATLPPVDAAGARLVRILGVIPQ
jgi:hypothetical protein